MKLFLHYLEIYNTTTNKQTGVTQLARWYDMIKCEIKRSNNNLSSVEKTLPNTGAEKSR
jgi:hypothetical protein